MPSCRCLPHGWYTVVPAVLTTLAWIANLFQDGCAFAQVSSVTSIVTTASSLSTSTSTFDVVAQLAQNPEAPWLALGFAAFREPVYNTERQQWESVFTGACFAYPSSWQRDAFWKTAEALDFLARVLGGAGALFLWFSSCCVFSKGTWRWAGYQVLLAAVCQALAFLWFRTSLCHAQTITSNTGTAVDDLAFNTGTTMVSSTTCSLFWGSKADIASAVVWTLAAAFVFCHYPHPVEACEDGVWQQQAVEVTSPSVRVTESSRKSPKVYNKVDLHGSVSSLENTPDDQTSGERTEEKRTEFNDDELL